MYQATAEHFVVSGAREKDNHYVTLVEPFLISLFIALPNGLLTSCVLKNVVNHMNI